MDGSSEPANKKGRADEDETDFSMAGQAKGEITEVAYIRPDIINLNV